MRCTVSGEFIALVEVPYSSFTRDDGTVSPGGMTRKALILQAEDGVVELKLTDQAWSDLRPIPLKSFVHIDVQEREYRGKITRRALHAVTDEAARALVASSEPGLS